MLQEDRAVDRHPRDAQEVEGAPGVEAVVDTQAPALRKSASITGFLFALAAAMLFGVGFVVRKAGLAGYDSAVAGAFIGAMTALGMIIVSAGARRQLDGLVEANFRRVPWWFVAGGVASGFALLAQFKAFDYLPAWVVSLLQGTQAVWTILFSYLFLRDEEDIGWRLLLSIGLVVCGVAVMTLQL
jgi:drug/metabolite transporter (DMT)-like permease